MTAGWIIFGIGQILIYILLILAILASHKKFFSLAFWSIAFGAACTVSSAGLLTLGIGAISLLF